MHCRDDTTVNLKAYISCHGNTISIVLADQMLPINLRGVERLTGRLPHSLVPCSRIALSCGDFEAVDGKCKGIQEFFGGGSCRREQDHVDVGSLGSGSHNRFEDNVCSIETNENAYRTGCLSVVTPVHTDVGSSLITLTPFSPSASSQKTGASVASLLSARTGSTARSQFMGLDARDVDESTLKELPMDIANEIRLQVARAKKAKGGLLSSRKRMRVQSMDSRSNKKNGGPLGLYFQPKLAGSKASPGTRGLADNGDESQLHSGSSTGETSKSYGGSINDQAASRTTDSVLAKFFFGGNKGLE